ncbi:MAG TPA: TRAP transporter substrate-binding protein DctP [Burkholderiales bacterium]|nr:TRAP transporter substrate-binding protein DctP [Burkholderiales bacterium]
MSRNPDIRKLCAAAVLAVAGGAMAAEAVLVHDIAPPHPRYTQLTQMAAEVAKRTQGTLTIAINPGGKVLYPGQASLAAVRNKTAPLAFINSAFLQSVDPDLGFLNLPFTITDALMSKPGVTEGVLALVRSYVEPRGLKVLAVMRGADTIVIFKNRQVRAPDDMKGLKIRVAGPGVYQDIVRSLGAAPVVFPAIEMGAALARGAMDGIITSPGGWGKNVHDAPSASLVPGLLFYTYFLIADKTWFDALPAVQQKALAESARASVTDKWGEMQADDARLVAELVSRGAAYAVVPVDAVAAWRARTEGVTREFATAHPEVMRRFRAVVGAE